MTELLTSPLADRDARASALDTSGSVLVQAPAGSGKTELLALRFLKLLAQVEEPEQILGITFSRAATAEIRHRIVEKLELAKSWIEQKTWPEGQDEDSREIVTAAYTNSVNRGWRLLEQPQRLDIETIDSLCLRIAHQMPLSGKPGGTLQPTDNAAPLYRRAARKTLDQLGGSNEELNHALRALLHLRDGRLANLETLLAQMLATRDQWTRALPLTGVIDWDETRERLEEPFRREIHRVLGDAHRVFSARPDLTQELVSLIQYASTNLEAGHKTSLWRGLKDAPSPTHDFAQHWGCLRDLFLTEKGELRKRFDKNNGFPPEDDGEKERLKALAQTLGSIPGFCDLLVEIRDIPPAHFTDEQWQILLHIFVALRQAVRELSSVFSEQGQVDFIEISLAARDVLSSEGARGVAFQHLLVDEFQDTSRSQHALIAALLRDWTSDSAPEKPRTIFLVGDPMQSIYMFRQADVELFNLVQTHGFATGNGRLAAKPLKLTTNFRSNAGVVTPLNNMFATVFRHEERANAAPVDFLPGTPWDRAEPHGAYQVHPDFKTSERSSLKEARLRETAAILEIVRHHMPSIERARDSNKDFTVAVLARAKNHLLPLAAALQKGDIPFRAVEIQDLGERQEILDLQSLTRALLHPMDRIAWLAVLRAPWCRLTLGDLHSLCGTDGIRSPRDPVLQQIQDRAELLADEPRVRLERVVLILKAALARRGKVPFASWIERTWNSLNGPACVSAAGLENAWAYFRMLENVSPDGIAATGEAMKDRLSRLCASPDPSVSERCGVQLMTMHKAKGLGFNVVVLPGLERVTGRDPQSLIRYLERSTDSGTEFLVAPIDKLGSGTSPLNEWVGRQKAYREAEERKRLLYVACTRARQELHLFGAVERTRNGLSPKDGSLLHTAWPALRGKFEAEDAIRSSSQPDKNIVEFLPLHSDSSQESEVLESIAAAGNSTTIYRLPWGWKPEAPAPNVSWGVSRSPSHPSEDSADNHRPHGSRSSRILGTAVHALLERSAQLFDQGATEATLQATMPRLEAYASTSARDAGQTPREAAAVGRQAVVALQAALADPQGRWVLNSHPRSQSEASWTGVIGGVARNLRIDRTFRAGAEPLTEGSEYLWIVDYKTATHGSSGLSEFLDNEKMRYAEQLEGYGTMMRLAEGENLQLRMALYYPMLKQLVWWMG